VVEHIRCITDLLSCIIDQIQGVVETTQHFVAAADLQNGMQFPPRFGWIVWLVEVVTHQTFGAKTEVQSDRNKRSIAETWVTLVDAVTRIVPVSPSLRQHSEQFGRLH